MFFGAAVGVGVVVGVLLEEADLDHARDVEDELLLVGEGLGAQEADDFFEGVLALEDGVEVGADAGPLLVDVLGPPGGD